MIKKRCNRVCSVVLKKKCLINPYRESFVTQICFVLTIDVIHTSNVFICVCNRVMSIRVCFCLQGKNITSMSLSTSLPTRSVSTWAGPPPQCCSLATRTSSVIRHGRISSQSSLEAPVRPQLALCISLCVLDPFVSNYLAFFSRSSQQSPNRPPFHQYGLAGRQARCRRCHGGASPPQPQTHAVVSPTGKEAQQPEEEAQQEAHRAKKAQSPHTAWWFVGLWWLVWLRRLRRHRWRNQRAGAQKHTCAKCVFFPERYEHIFNPTVELSYVSTNHSRQSLSSLL